MAKDEYFGAGMMRSLGSIESVLGRQTIEMPKIATHADTMYEQIVLAMKDFQEELRSDEELGAQVANFGARMTIAIEDVGYHNPFMIKLYGTTENGDRCTLLQHMNQVSILLVAVKAKHTPAKRIGFVIPAEQSHDTETGEP